MVGKHFPYDEKEWLRFCVDFRDLNIVTPKDMYVMPIADMLVDSTTNKGLDFPSWTVSLGITKS